MRARGPSLAAMAVLVACRVQEPGPPSAAAFEPRGAVASAASRPEVGPEPAPVEPEPTPPADAIETPAEPEPMPLPQAVVPIETPFSSRALVMLPAHDTSPVVLFADELAAVRRRAGEVLAAQRVELVPVPELERIEAAAAEGRLVLEGEQQCRAPLTPWEVAARYFPGRPRLLLSADCFGDCRLRAQVDDPPRFEDIRTWQSRKLARPHDPKAWLAAAGSLRLTEAFGIGGLGLFGTTHSPPVRFDPPSGIGPWGEEPLESAPFDALEGMVAGCAHPDPLVGFRWQLRVSVDRQGRVTRCTADSDHSMARAAAAPCLCGAVETLAFPAGAAGRRLRVEAVDDGGFGTSARLELVQPGTETWVRRLEEAPALARCMAAHPLPGKLSARVILALAPDGAVEDVRIEGEITTAPAMGLASCLVQELRLVPLPCRPPGVDALHLSLVVNG